MLIGLMTAAANLVVGVFVGLCGVAGFLLPMFYTTVLEMRVSQGLALSFSAFIVSGILGSWNFKKAGNLDVGFGFRLSIGSLAGAVLGVYLNRIIPEERVKVLLYLVVLLSGISILCRKDKKSDVQGKDSAVNAECLSEKQRSISIRNNLPLTFLLGFVTGAVCSLSGAGGPVLVMPLLVSAGNKPSRIQVNADKIRLIAFGNLPALPRFVNRRRAAFKKHPKQQFRRHNLRIFLRYTVVNIHH